MILFQDKYVDSTIGFCQSSDPAISALNTHKHVLYSEYQGGNNEYGETAFSRVQGNITAKGKCFGTGAINIAIVPFTSQEVILAKGHTIYYGIPDSYIRADVWKKADPNLYIWSWARSIYYPSTGKYNFMYRTYGVLKQPDYLTYPSKQYGWTYNEDVKTNSYEKAFSAFLNRAKSYARYEHYVQRVSWISVIADYKQYNVIPGTIPAGWLDANFVSEFLSLADRALTSRIADAVQGEALLSVCDNAQATDVVNLENIIQLIGDIRDFPSIGQNVAKSLKTYADKPIKAIADAKLSYDYSFKTTVSDVRDISQSLDKWMRTRNEDYSIARGRHSDTIKGQFGSFAATVFLQEAYKVYYGSADESLLPVYRRLQNIGLDPSFEHVWNVIPYSFVVDWVLPTQKVLKQMDYSTSVATLPIRAVTHGRWVRYQFDNGTLQADISVYHRTLEDELPRYPYFLPQLEPNMNWFNAGSLLVQRIR